MRIAAFNQSPKMEKIQITDLYTKGKRLGKGNYGITYLCTQIATGHHYACKCISKHNLISKQDHERVEREIDILRLINLKEHPNIVSIKDVFENDDNVYIVMELCEGGELFDHVVDHGAFPEAKAAKTIKEIVGAIEACHSYGIVHRDLKLENLLLQTRHEDSMVKIIDFGLAQFFEHGEVLTDAVGSPTYIAPEVIEGHHGPKVDIWSAGVILYTLLCGYSPFHANTFEGTYHEIMRGNAPFFQDGPWPRISDDAKDLVQRMMKYNVNERLNASEVLQHPWIQRNVK